MDVQKLAGLAKEAAEGNTFAKVDLMTFFSSLSEDEATEIAQSAVRWKGLLAACPDALGSAGLDWNSDGSVNLKIDSDGYIHTGICNFNTQASPSHFNEVTTTRGRNILIAIADQVIKQGGPLVCENGEQKIAEPL